jgi:predicted oxidoreductase
VAQLSTLGHFDFMSDDYGKEYLQNIMDGVARAGREAEFAKINRRELAGWRDEVLAAWQAKYPPDSPQFILAQYEWSRRLTADQIRATLTSARQTAWFGIWGAAIGAAVGAFLTLLVEWLSK